MGAEMGVPTFQVLLGEVYQRGERIPDALAMVEDGLAVSRRNNDRHYDAELYRLKGELLMKSAPGKRARSIEETEACFQSAIHVARKQKTRSLELRAATALAHLWRDNGKSRDAYHLLHRIYRQFTEGFDTPDLTQARTLLDELG